jgi:hypothetical protein
MRNHHAYAISVFLMWVAGITYTVLVVLHVWRILAFRAAVAVDPPTRVSDSGSSPSSRHRRTRRPARRRTPPCRGRPARGRLARVARARIRGAVVDRRPRPLALPGRAIRERHLIHLGHGQPVGSGACRCARTSRRHRTPGASAARGVLLVSRGVSLCRRRDLRCRHADVLRAGAAGSHPAALGVHGRHRDHRGRGGSDRAHDWRASRLPAFRLVQHGQEEAGMHLGYLRARHPEMGGGNVHHVRVVSSRVIPSCRKAARSPAPTTPFTTVPGTQKALSLMEKSL